MAAIIGVDLGGTKLSTALFNQSGKILQRSGTQISGKKGQEVGALIINETDKLLKIAQSTGITVSGVGICVPGIYSLKTGKVWAPNIPGWDDYPLLEEVKAAFSGYNINVSVASDRTCYILGETWQGIAKGSENAIYISVGTGIGAGIMCDGHIIRGHGDIAGAIGWLGLTGVYHEKYKSCGCFEYHASGTGLVKSAKEVFANEVVQAQEVFNAFSENNPLAAQVIETAIKMWGMASANLISIFNPEILIFGGGIFGPAARFLPQIRQEAEKWAQPISFKQVRFEVSSLGGDAGLMGAAKLATDSILC